MKFKSFIKSLMYVLKNEPLMMIVVMLLVPIIFRSIVDLRVAALFAGMLFLLIAVLTLRQGVLGKDYFLSGASLLFLIVFILPIFYLRLAHWSENFRGLSFLGIPSTWLHENSKWVYSVILILSVRQRYMQYKKLQTRS